MSKSSTTSTISAVDRGLLSSGYVEQVYSLYQEDPGQVSAEWQDYSRALQNKPSTAQPPQAAPSRPLRSGVSTVAPAAALPGTSLVPSTANKSNGASAVQGQTRAQAPLVGRTHKRRPRAMAARPSGVSRGQQVPLTALTHPRSARKATARRPVEERSRTISSGIRTPKAACRKASTC